MGLVVGLGSRHGHCHAGLGMDPVRAMSNASIQLDLAAQFVGLGLVSVGAVWQALSGGRTNSLWRIDCDGQTVVCKLFRHNAVNPLFPNEIDDEAQALALLSDSGLAPKLIARAQTDHGPCLLYQYVDGPVWRQEGALVARLLARLHARPERPAVRKIASGSQALVAQSCAILGLCSGPQVRQLQKCRPSGDVAPVTSPVLVHGDVVPNNVLITVQGPMLIDWQCPAIADPCEDIATFLSPAMQVLYGAAPFTAAQTDEFLLAYGRSDITDRYRCLAGFFNWRMAAYCLWRSQNGAPDYQSVLALELAAL